MIIGTGQEEKKLKKLAGPTIRFLGAVTQLEVAQWYRQSKALVFPGIEDFGITIIEALASGLTVIAYQEGGATETLTPLTGLFFKDQSVASLVEAIKQMEQSYDLFQEQNCMRQAQYFSKERFQSQFLSYVTPFL